MVLRLCVTVELFSLPVRNIFPRTSLHDLPCHRTMWKYSHPNSRKMVAFPKRRQKSWIRNIFGNCLTISLLIWHSRWLQPNWTWSRNDVGSPKSPFSQLLSTFGKCFVSSQPVSYHPQTQTRIVLFLSSRKSIPISKLFTQPCSNRAFPNCLSHNSPAKGWPYRFRSEGTTGSSMLDNDSGHLCRGRRIQLSGHSLSYFGILKISEHLPFLLGYKLMLRPLLVHRNMAIWRWDPWS